jgi:hypothetical protein
MGAPGLDHSGETWDLVYSARKAYTGLSREVRHAGSRHATAATASSAAETAANTPTSSA